VAAVRLGTATAKYSPPPIKDPGTPTLAFTRSQTLAEITAHVSLSGSSRQPSTLLSSLLFLLPSSSVCQVHLSSTLRHACSRLVSPLSPGRAVDRSQSVSGGGPSSLRGTTRTAATPDVPGKQVAGLTMRGSCGCSIRRGGFEGGDAGLISKVNNFWSLEGGGREEKSGGGGGPGRIKR
jgi:hypothetical protein